MHCRQIMNSPPIMEKKQAPEPPRRHCSTGIAVGSGSNCNVDQISEHFDAINLSSQQHMLYTPKNSYNSPHHHYQQPHFVSQQVHAQYVAPNIPHHLQHQPIYANYNVMSQHHMQQQQQQQQPMHVQTTVEVHVEKQPTAANDSKVLQMIQIIILQKYGIRIFV